MEQINSNTNKKRDLIKFKAEDLMSKLRSKSDFYKFLDEKCKLVYTFIFFENGNSKGYKDFAKSPNPSKPIFLFEHKRSYDFPR